MVPLVSEHRDVPAGAQGERAFIDRLRARLPGPPAGEHWIGDDAAVLDEGLLLKTDVLAEGVHFDLDWSSPEDVGWKALAVNLSDIAAMGGSPIACVISLVVHRDRPGMADRIMDGLGEAGPHFGCPVVGGDTSVGPGLVVAVAVLGRAPAGGAVLRSGARPGDVLLVTGELGAAAAALEAWRANREEHPGLERLRRPTPRLASGAAAAAGGATGMIDISDGLATDLGHLCAESGCSAVLDGQAIPRPPGVGIDPALFGGEDYELLFTASADRVNAFTRWVDPPAVAIGLMTEAGPEITIRDSDGERPLAQRGWEHPIP